MTTIEQEGENDGTIRKKRRLRKKWNPCEKCNSKHGMRFGYVTNHEFEYLACDKCKSDDMKDLSRVCKCSGKDLRYGVLGGSATHCFVCKEPNMVNLRPSSGLCECGSSKVRRYGISGGPRTHCLECKLPGMVNLSLSTKQDSEGAWGGRCECGSSKTRRFGYPGSTKRTHCNDCRKEGMINLTQRLCTCGSERQVRYGYDSTTPPTHCSICKKPDMVDLTKKKRNICECGSQRQVRFGLPGGEGGETVVATKCSKCRDPNMVDLTKKRAPAAAAPQHP